MSKRLTTEELQKQEFWPELLAALNAAAENFKRECPGTKVELVRKKYVFWILVDGVPEVEIDCYDLQQSVSQP